MSTEISSKERGKIIEVKIMLAPPSSWQTDEKVRQSLLSEIKQLGEVLIHSIKQDFYTSMSQKKFKRRIDSNLLQIGAVGVIGAEQLLNNEIIDDDFIQDIIKLAEEDKHSLSAAFALLGIEIAKKEGKYIPIILKDFNSPFTRALFINHLGKIKWSEKVVDSLIDLLSEDFVIFALGLRRYITDGYSLHASRALLEIGNERGIETMVLSLFQKLSERADPNPEGYIQFFLIEAGKPVIKYLIQGLSLDDPQARISAAYCLGDIGDPSALEALARNTKAEDEKTVYAAVIALGKLEDHRAIPVLLPLLGSKSWTTPGAAKQSLNKLKDVWQAPQFIAVLNHEDQRVVLFAINALKIIKDKSANEPLIVLLESDNKKIRKAAFKALKAMK